MLTTIQKQIFLGALLFFSYLSMFSQTSTYSRRIGPSSGSEYIYPSSFVMNAVPVTPPTSYYDQSVVLSTYRTIQSAPVDHNSLLLNSVSQDGYLNDPTWGGGKFKKLSYPLGMIVQGEKIIKDGSDYLILGTSGDVAVTPGILIIKVNSSFNILWSKVYQNGQNLIAASDFKIEGSNIVVCGSVYNGTTATTEKPFIIRVDKNTGVYGVGYSYSLPINCYGGFDAISPTTVNMCAGHFVNLTGQKQLMLTRIDAATGTVSFNYLGSDNNVKPYSIKPYGISTGGCIYNGWIVAGAITVPGGATLKDMFFSNLKQNVTCGGTYEYGTQIISSSNIPNSQEELVDFTISTTGGSTSLNINAVGTISFSGIPNSLLHTGFVYDPVVNYITNISSKYYPVASGQGTNKGVDIELKGADEVAILGLSDIGFAMPRELFINTPNYTNTTFKDACRLAFNKHLPSGYGLTQVTTNLVISPTTLAINLPTVNIVSTNMTQNTVVVCEDFNPNKLANTTDISQDKIIQNTLLYPNPATNQLNISLPSDKEIQNLIIMNMNGQILMEKRIDKSVNFLELDIANLPSAMYIVKFQGKDTQETYKFVKE